MNVLMLVLMNVLELIGVVKNQNHHHWTVLHCVQLQNRVLQENVVSLPTASVKERMWEK